MNDQAMMIECPCGVVLRDDDEAGVIAAAQEHASRTHEMTLSDEQAREMAHPV